MKKVLVILAGAVSLFSSAHASEVSAGVKAYYSYSAATKGIMGLEGFGSGRHFGGAGLYGRYMFHDMVGVGFSAGWLGLGNSVELSTAEETSGTVKKYIHTNNIGAALTLEFCPIGHDHELGAFFIRLGVQNVFPLMNDKGLLTKKKAAPGATTTVADTSNADEAGEGESEGDKGGKLDGLSSFPLGVLFGLEYEHPCGFTVDANFVAGFLPIFEKDKASAAELADDHTYKHFTAGVGFNLYKLFEDEE